jgi:hypothetical protein
MFNEATKQIQGYPTPEIYVRRGGGTVKDSALAMLELESFVAVLADLLDAGTEEIVAPISLQSMLVNGKQPVATQDDFGGTLQLQSMVTVTADQISNGDEFLASIALQSMVAVTAQPINNGDEFLASIALQSMVV